MHAETGRGMWRVVVCEVKGETGQEQVDPTEGKPNRISSASRFVRKRSVPRTKKSNSVTFTQPSKCIISSTVSFYSRNNIVKHVKAASGGLLSECSVRDLEQRQLKLKHTWHWFVLLPTTADQSQAVQIEYGR